ncbi:hypothetical protein ACF090_25165 [Streptomyces sp. NPDC014892]|uniref:hypothetical protein n=1 Tax=Streptomyces sp. NPDC014892 TaxID=3364930 RepID=UPI0036F7E19F
MTPADAARSPPVNGSTAGSSATASTTTSSAAGPSTASLVEDVLDGAPAFLRL